MTGWIKYTDLKPPINRWVLCAVEGYDSADIAWHNEQGNFHVRGAPKKHTVKPTHWQFVPEMPWGIGTYWK